MHQNHLQMDQNSTYRKDLTPKEKLLLLELRRRKQVVLQEIQQLKDEISAVSKELEIMEQSEDCSTQPTSKVKQWSNGRKKFNISPKKGLEYLMKNCLLNNTAEEIASFLYKSKGLNKMKIGDYLGEREDMNISVLKHFIDLHDFKGDTLVAALRKFLWSFRLPGEAQKIDRMMEAFAVHYCSQCEGSFRTVDACYVLSFSVIMLNTSLHNANVKDKITLDGFVRMNQGINDGEDFPRDMLEELYESIKAEPFKIPEDDGNDITHTFFNAKREGQLTKEGGVHKTWRPRYFILKDNCLYYFKSKGDNEPRGIIPLENLQVVENNETKRKFCFEIVAQGGSLIKACKTDSDGKVVTGHHDVYRICASSAEERREWIESIKNSISKDPFYDMLAIRKKKAMHVVQS